MQSVNARKDPYFEEDLMILCFNTYRIEHGQKCNASLSVIEVLTQLALNQFYRYLIR
jgi:hypothetical protein